MIDPARARRLRIPLGFFVSATYLAFARPTARTLAIGASIAFVGVLIRAWAAGHIQKEVRLAVTGPYAHTRNPLYLGSFLIACGFAVAAHVIALIVVVAFFLIVYAPTIDSERTQIASRFPALYPDYERNVPAFVPRLAPWRPTPRDATRFNGQLYMRHGEWQAALGFLATVAWLFIRYKVGF